MGKIMQETGKTTIIIEPSAASKAARENKIATAHRQYLAAFEACPDDYETLKSEAVHLGKLSGHAFLLMAQRLRKIRNLKLYVEEGYKSFKAFVEGEMTIGRSTVYDYMDILEAFGEERLMKEPEIECYKLAPAVPLLKSSVAGIPKAKIRKKFLDGAKTSTHREMKDIAKDLRARYGLDQSGRAATAKEPDPLEAGIARFLAIIPDGPLSKQQKQRLRVLIKELTAVLVRPTS